MTPEQMIQTIHQSHRQNFAAYQKLQSGAASVERVRKGMDKLLDMGPAVTTEDVIKAAGVMVEEGVDTKQLAVKLATAPPGGAALADWVRKQDVEMRKVEAQFMQAKEKLRQQLGNGVMQMMGAHAAMAQGGQAQPQIAPPQASGLSAAAQPPQQNALGGTE